MQHEDPALYIATASKAKRNNKIFIDYLRNSRGATSVASYSTRARAGAPVAMPLRWEELGKLKSPDQYTVENSLRRLSTLKTDPWDGFFTIKQTLR
jgi:bifunctional non-homologous end joining protein LigD